METRKLRILVTGPDSSQLIQYITRESINEQHHLEYSQYFFVDNNGTKITDIDSYLRKNRLTRGNQHLNISRNSLTVGKEMLGVYELSITQCTDWEKINEFGVIDALVVAIPSSSEQYIDDYMKYAITYPKLLFAFVHTRFDYNSAETVKDNMVDKLLAEIQQERETYELSRRIYNVRPVHIFVDLDYDKRFSYREYITKTAFQNMLRTIWTLRHRDLGEIIENMKARRLVQKS